MAPYLPTCLDSLAAQSWQAEEIIAIDDGSTDSSPDILADYTQRMPNLRIIRQENGGLAAARNSGLAVARSKWLLFVDSDDFIAPEMIESLVSIAEQDDLDVTICNAIFHHEGRKPDHPLYTTAPNSRLQSGREWLKERLRAKFLPHMVWMHLYRRTLLEEQGLRFIEGQVHEDVIWTNQVMLAAKRVRHIDKALYFYRIRTSRSGADAQRRSREYVIPCSIRNTLEIDRMTDALADDPDLQRLMRWQVFDGGNAVFHLILKFPTRRERLEHMDILRSSGFLTIMYKNAQTISQRRKILKMQLMHWLHAV